MKDFLIDWVTFSLLVAVAQLVIFLLLGWEYDIGMVLFSGVFYALGSASRNTE